MFVTLSLICFHIYRLWSCYIFQNFCCGIFTSFHMYVLWTYIESGHMFLPMYLQNSVCEQYSYNLPGASLCAALRIGELLANEMVHNHLSKEKS